MKLEHTFVRDELGLARSRDQVRGHGRDGHATRGQDDPVRVARGDVGDLLVERLPARIPLAKLGLVLRQGPAAPAHARPGQVDVDVQVDREDVELVQEVPRLDRAAADGDHARLAAAAGLAEEPRFELAKGTFSPLREDLPDRPLGPLDLIVDVEERPAQAPRDLAADRRLAGSHEADQRDMPP